METNGVNCQRSTKSVEVNVDVHRVLKLQAAQNDSTLQGLAHQILVDWIEHNCAQEVISGSA